MLEREGDLDVTLLRIVGDGPERLVAIRQARLQIGRARANDIVLPEAEKGVSRAHAELRFENGRYVIVDLQSQNGTWLDGRRVERAEVSIGSEIVVGEYRLYLEKGTAAAVLPPTEIGGGRPAPEVRADDLRIREEPMTRALPVLPKPPVTPPAASPPRWVVGAALGAVALVVLAAVVWLSRSGPVASSPAAQPQVSVPDPPEPLPEVAAAASASSSGTASAPTQGAGVAAPDNRPAPAATTAAARDPSGGVKRRVAPAPASVPFGGDGPRVQRKPGESADAWRSRAAALETRYDYSRAALERGDFAAAAGGFEAILLEEPGFRDAPQLLVQARAGLRASARMLVEAGDRLDATGDWMGALQKYEQARQIFAVPGLDAKLRRVRDKLRVEGTNAFNLAREHDANGRIEEAVREYEKAVQWLPEHDTNRLFARARLEQIKRL